MVALFPTEILFEIFEAACTNDDGATGRSLSRVSRRFCETSRPFRLRSVAVRGEKELLAFAEVLKGMPAEHRLVRHLFVSNNGSGGGGGGVTRSVVGSSQGDFWESQPDASNALVDILTLVAPTLRTLYVVSDTPRTSLFVPVSLPQVTSITLQGRIAVHSGGKRDESAKHTFPSLRHLSLLSFKESSSNMLGEISQRAPGLSQVTLAPECSSRELYYNLVLVQATSQPSAFLPSVPRIRIILTRSSDGTACTNMTRNLVVSCLKKSAEADPRFTVLDVEEARVRERAEYWWREEGL